MAHKIFRLINLLSLSFVLWACNSDTASLKQTKLLADYPSGSALAFLNDELYVMGDDATRMLLVDDEFNATGSISIADSPVNRLPKNVKQDFESLAVLGYGKNISLMLLGSGSLAPHRNFCAVVDPKKKTKTFYNLTSFYDRLKKDAVKEINIEGATALPGGLVLANRGNKTYRRNHLIFTDPAFFAHPDSAVFRWVQVGTNTDTSLFHGVSGLDYAAGSDKLLMTVSTENTYNSYSDGSIGKSYLWIVNDISNRKRISHINPDKIIDLDNLDSRFAGHKIESVCIQKETRSHLLLVLAADDDKGQTILFRLRIKK